MSQPSTIEHAEPQERITMPAVSVLMTVYNGERYLRKAIESVLSQTFRDFECIVIDDASTDGSKSILSSFTDNRLRIFRNLTNIGLTLSLNRALDLARGRYVARMDADDVCQPARFEKQVYFLESHADIGLIGCGVTTIDESGNRIGDWLCPQDDVAIRWQMLFESPFAHPAVMLRRQILVANRLTYDSAFRVAQDYELWTRLLNHTKGANLSELLLEYRIHNDSASSRRGDEQRSNQLKVGLRTFASWVPNVSLGTEAYLSMRNVFLGEPVKAASDVELLAYSYALALQTVRKNCRLSKLPRRVALRRQLRSSIRLT